MDNIYAIRGRLGQFYAEYSKFLDKGLQLVLALVTFLLINSNVGFMKLASSPLVSVGLAIIAMFLPINFTLLIAGILILDHMYALSLGALATTAIIFVILYIFFFRLTPDYAVLVILTPVAFALKIPYIIPVICGLILAPTSLFSVGSGAVVYYMMAYVKKSSSSLEASGIKAMLGVATKYIQHILTNKEMWIMICAFIIAFFVTYTLRRTSMDHAWKVAIVAGTIVNVVVVAVGNIAMGVSTSFGSLVIGSVGTIIVGLTLEVFFFAVDYSRCENVQYEDDEYYYYVKAVPKLAIAAAEKTLKHINEHESTEIMDTDQIREKASRKNTAESRSSRSSRRSGEDVERQLLEESLKKDLGFERNN